MEKILNLVGVISPLDLLKCKQTLNAMKKGEVLKVILADPEVARSLITIVDRSRDELFFQEKRQNHICLGIKKG